mmetsp:Transcript_1056/g.2169  ORF Transcript_1056/g.2169 Transcript_1056/m.2169 type:complete len:231 (+) Transcript_1056:1617-2309(+)
MSLSWSPIETRFLSLPRAVSLRPYSSSSSSPSESPSLSSPLSSRLVWAPRRLLRVDTAGPPTSSSSSLSPSAAFRRPPSVFPPFTPFEIASSSSESNKSESSSDSSTSPSSDSSTSSSSPDSSLCCLAAFFAGGADFFATGAVAFRLPALGAGTSSSSSSSSPSDSSSSELCTLRLPRPAVVFASAFLVVAFVEDGTAPLLLMRLRRSISILRARRSDLRSISSSQSLSL